MISVCLASYNGEPYIKEQLDSILRQLSENDEVVISDDGSTDRTLEIVAAINDHRVVLLENTKKQYGYNFDYVTHNFENALKHASGDFIFLADQDDIWLPHKISLFISELEKYDLVLSDCRVVNEKLDLIFTSYFGLVKTKKGVFPNLYHNSFLGCCMAFKKEVLDKSLPFPRSGVPHDIWLGMISECFFKTSLIYTPTLLYRRHGKNASPSSETSSFLLKDKLFFRIKIIYELLKKIIL